MQLVASWIVRQRGYEEAFGSGFLHELRGAVHHQGSIHGLREECAYLPAMVRLMRTQHGKRIAVRTIQDGFQLLGSHAQLLWQRAITTQELGTQGVGSKVRA